MIKRIQSSKSKIKVDDLTIEELKELVAKIQKKLETK